MGEAKRKKTTGTFEGVDGELRAIGVPTGEFGFYDSEPFLAAERQDPSFLEKYARWVQLRPRDVGYEDHVRQTVPVVADLLATALAKDGAEGGCVNTSSMLARMLDRLGVWSFGVRGCTTLEVKNINERRAFPTVDRTDFEGGITGHAWIVAPPFQVVDATIATQWWHGDPLEKYVPRTVLIEEGAVVEPEVGDVVSDEFRLQYARLDRRVDTQLHHRLEPRLRAFGKRFPGVEIISGDLRVRYVPVAIGLSDTTLEDIESPYGLGRSPAQIWAEDVAPKFKHLLV